jgi:hypothetical protein
MNEHVRVRKEQQDYQRDERDERYDGFEVERTNLDRVLNARDMVALATTGTLYLEPFYEDYEDGLVDALTNLMHFARRYEIDFAQALLVARRHHEVEAQEGWE